jgi:hypothetical protein
MESSVKAVYAVVEGTAPDHPMLRRVGTGFVNRDTSLSIVLDALPVSGRLHVRDLAAACEPGEGRAGKGGE